ncbi:MAG: acylphosphatase [Spirochaetaceae bacterium]|jgi:acylphosphatase|nr:acylphosphatase [Spirochaetaceae bacterium]
MGITAFSAVVTGRVQGVGFRWTAAAEAERLGVKGWVRNTSGGEVEVWAEGPEAAAHEFLAWLHRGPRHARVDEVCVVWMPVHGYKRFSIDHGACSKTD